MSKQKEKDTTYRLLGKHGVPKLWSCRAQMGNKPRFRPKPFPMQNQIHLPIRFWLRLVAIIFKLLIFSENFISFESLVRRFF